MVQQTIATCEGCGTTFTVQRHDDGTIRRPTTEVDCACPPAS